MEKGLFQILKDYILQTQNHITKVMEELEKENPDIQKVYEDLEETQGDMRALGFASSLEEIIQQLKLWGLGE